MGLLLAGILERVAISSSTGSSKPRSPSIAGGSLLSGPPGKAMKTGVFLFLLQGTFPTQESNRGLLHCRQILYQLSYQDRPITSLLPLDDEAGQHFFFFADLGLPCCVRTFSSCHVQTPHCGGFCCCRAWAQGGRASVIAAHQPRSCDRQV